MCLAFCFLIGMRGVSVEVADFLSFRVAFTFEAFDSGNLSDFVASRVL